jgi:N-acetylneuraminate synthase
VVEVHVTLSREAFGPDVPASITTAELAQLVEGIRFIEAMHRHPVDKQAMAGDLAPLRDLFGKSIVARTHLAAGTVLQPHHLALKKPGSGIPASRLGEIVNRRLRLAVAANTLLDEQHLD